MLVDLLLLNVTLSYRCDMLVLHDTSPNCWAHLLIATNEAQILFLVCIVIAPNARICTLPTSLILNHLNQPLIAIRQLHV